MPSLCLHCLQEAYKGLRIGSLGMPLLISVGTNCAYFFGLSTVLQSVLAKGRTEPALDHMMTSAMLISFMLLGKVMETRAKVQTAFAIKHLLKCQPRFALLVTDGVESCGDCGTGERSEKEVPVDLLHRGDIVKVIHNLTHPTLYHLSYRLGSRIAPY